MLRRLLYKNFRLIYRLNQWTLHRFTPMGSLLLGGTVGAGIFGIDTRQSMAYQIFTLTASLILISILTVFTFRGSFRVRRQLPDFATEGTPTSYKLYVKNRTNNWQKELLLIDELETPLPSFEEFIHSHDPMDKQRNWFDRKVGYPRLMGLIQNKRGAEILPIAMEDISPADETEVKVTLLPARRGYLHFQQTRIARPDPLGLFRAMKYSPNKDSLLVLPKTYNLPPIQFTGTRKHQRGGLNLASSIGDSQEFMSLRDYRPGDPLRAIHWRSYAKRGHPVVKEFQDEYYVRQGLLLDTFIEDKSTSAFEEAVSMAASFAVSIHNQDTLLDLMFVGTEAYRFTSGRGLSKTENMLEILACVEPCVNEYFQEMENLIQQHTQETSGLTCIFLDWDEKRQALIRKISAQGIPAMVILVTEKKDIDDWDLSSLNNDPGKFIVLHPGMIQNTLDQMEALGVCRI